MAIPKIVKLKLKLSKKERSEIMRIQRWEKESEKIVIELGPGPRR